MPNQDPVRIAADHLRALADVSRSRPATLVALLLCAGASALGEDQTGWPWFAGMAAALLLLPWLLHRLLPKGNLVTYRLDLATFPLRALLVWCIAFLESSKLPPIEIEELPRMTWLYPALSVVAALAYLVLRFPAWRRRLQGYRRVVRDLREPGDAEVLAQVRDLAERAVARTASTSAPWAEFRTVPAAPRNWKLFLRLDLERHGDWRVAFSRDYALVVARDGSCLEAVPKGGLRIATEDPGPGGKPFLCLVRWNAHLHEGRIREGSLRLIQSWNLRKEPDGAA